MKADKIIYRLSRLIAKPLLPPQLLIISLTEACNLKCVNCNIKSAPTKENLQIDIDKLSDVLLEAKKMGIRGIVLSGGEPFLVENIFKLIDIAKKLGQNISVTTNGSLGDSICEKIAASNIDHLHFSFDGLEDAHDRIRGVGAFEKLIRTINQIRNLKPNQSMGFGTVIYNCNCRALFEMTKLADELKINVMNFIPFLTNNIDPQHSKKGRECSLFWPSAEDLLCLEKNFGLIRGYKYANLKVEQNPSFELLSDYYSLRPIRERCYAGYKSMIITALRKENNKPVSNVFFCQDSCGNIYETSLNKSWNSLKAKKMRLKARMCNNPCLQFCHYI